MLQKRIKSEKLFPQRCDETSANIWGMSYKSTTDELFIVEKEKGVLRAISLRNNNQATRVLGVCYMSDLDKLLVFVSERNKRQLVVMSCVNRKWRKTQTLPIDAPNENAMISSALKNSKVLIGQFTESEYMELFNAENGKIIKRLNRIKITELYSFFSATSNGPRFTDETLVAISYYQQDLPGDVKEIGRAHV